MSELHLAAIYRYPVKSARGHALQAAQTDRFGLAGDRRWMLVDDRGHFVSQRRLAALALLGVEPRADGGLRLAFGGEYVDVAQPDPGGACVIATVWEDTVVAPLADATLNSWLSERLGESLRLVFCPSTALRGVEAGYAPPGQLVAFADGFPLLVVGEASLELLNSRLETPVPMDRFRPNLVVAGAAAHAEDDWRRLRIGTTEVELVKPCSRCAIPSIDQATGERDSQINRALAAYRRREGVIYFGMNALVPAAARFAVGDAVTVID